MSDSELNCPFYCFRLQSRNYSLDENARLSGMETEYWRMTSRSETSDALTEQS